MFDKKQNSFKSPDLKNMQEVVIDTRTRIYIPVGEDIQKAKDRYLSKNNFRKL